MCLSKYFLGLVKSSFRVLLYVVPAFISLLLNIVFYFDECRDGNVVLF
jgi:hypothetical protein